MANGLSHVAHNQSFSCLDFLGRVSDAQLAGLYRRATLFVSLSEHEGFCMPLVEAAAHGLPALAYRAGGVATAIGPHGLFATKRLDRIGARVLRVLDDPVLAAALRRAQSEHIQRYRREALAAGLARFIAALPPT